MFLTLCYRNRGVQNKKIYFVSKLKLLHSRSAAKSLFKPVPVLEHHWLKGSRQGREGRDQKDQERIPQQG